MTDYSKFPLAYKPEDEWTWVDDLAYSVRIALVIVSVVAAFGFLVWRVI